jgi:hypothetical protein
MTRQFENLQPSLFDEERPRIELRPAQRAELATVVEALLRDASRPQWPRLAHAN